MDVLNEGHARVDKEKFNQAVIALGSAITLKDDSKMAEEFKKVIPLFEELGKAAEEGIKITRPAFIIIEGWSL